LFQVFPGRVTLVVVVFERVGEALGAEVRALREPLAQADRVIEARALVDGFGFLRVVLAGVFLVQRRINLLGVHAGRQRVRAFAFARHEYRFVAVFIEHFQRTNEFFPPEAEF
jgi:hypothetical protein